MFEGAVTHRRLRPREHKLRYRVFSFLLELDEIDELHLRLKVFSRNRFNLFSFYDRDHADGKNGSVARKIRTILRDHGLGDCSARIHILCYPRILGFVFNPLSVYFCHRANGDIGAILYEVSNTFAQRHSYLIAVNRDMIGDNGIIRQNCAKRFYVSPFIAMDVDYHFKIYPPDKRVMIGICETDRNGALLTAAFSGERTALSDRNLARLFALHPLMTVKVIAGIYWQAMRLWRKKIALHKRPPPPGRAVTCVIGASANASKAKAVNPNAG
ncbi:MAG: DUF1365 family protein [Hyphomicrobiales bacterium]